MSFGLGSAASPTVNDAQEMDSGTPWIAASEGNLALLQTSLARLGMPATAVDQNGYTLLQAAASYGQMHVLQWLLVSSNASINAVDNDGDSALHYASTDGVVKLLCDAGIDRNIRNRAGKTALEAKREELQELKEDEDFEDGDEDAVQLRSVIDYLSNLETAMQ